MWWTSSRVRSTHHGKWNRIGLWVATLAKSVGQLVENPHSGERGYCPTISR